MAETPAEEMAEKVAEAPEKTPVEKVAEAPAVAQMMFRALMVSGVRLNKSALATNLGVVKHVKSVCFLV